MPATNSNADGTTESLLLRLGPAARYIGIAKPTLYRLIAAGELTVIDVYGPRLDRREIDDFIKRRREPRQGGRPSNSHEVEVEVVEPALAPRRRGRPPKSPRT